MIFGKPLEVNGVKKNEFLVGSAYTETNKAKFRKLSLDDLPQDYEKGFIFNDDFIYGASLGDWSIITSGNNSTVTQGNELVDYNHFGICKITAGNTQAGRSTLSKGTNNIQLGNCNLVLDSLLLLDTLSSDNTSYRFEAGLTDTTNNDIVNGVYFSYNLTESPNWLCVTSSNGVKNTMVSNNIVTEDVWIKLKIVIINAKAEFYINNSIVASTFQNVPIEPQRSVGLNYRIYKQSGNGIRSVYLDHTSMKFIFNTER